MSERKGVRGKEGGKGSSLFLTTLDIVVSSGPPPVASGGGPHAVGRGDVYLRLRRQ